MENGKNKEQFWRGLERSLEEESRKAESLGRRVGGVNVAWHLFISPLFAFIGAFFFSRNIIRGLSGLRDAVRAGVFRFAVNARLYEIEKGNADELERIRDEWGARSERDDV
ncbi:MAG: hypothetical protein V3S46_02550 [Nitrospinota bacterium]